jgi:hypothetical protein
VFAVVITGPPGAGKSAVATALHDALGDDGISNALFEVDELERRYPPPARDVTFGLVAHVAASCWDGAYPILVVTATIEDAAYRDGLLAAIGAHDVVLVCLTASPALLESRIRGREPADWRGVEGLVASARRLAATMPSPAADVVVETDELTPPQAAARIRVELARHAGV